MEPSFHDFEQAGWERAAEYYGDAFGSLTAQTIKPLLKAAGVTGGMRLLDVATGPGGVAAAAAEWGANPVGIDFSAHMVALARREHHPRSRSKRATPKRLRFADGSFDAVVINFGVLHLARPDTRARRGARECSVPAAAARSRSGRRPRSRWASVSCCARSNASAGWTCRCRKARRSSASATATSPSAACWPPDLPTRVSSRCRSCGVLPSAGALFDAFANGAVRTAALLRAQTPDALVDIHTAIAEEAATYRRGDVIELPMTAVLTSGSVRL